MGERYCTQCGQKLEAAAAFCTACGAPVAPPVEPQTTVPVLPHNAGGPAGFCEETQRMDTHAVSKAAAQPINPSVAENSPQRKKGLSPIALGAVVFLTAFVLVGGGAALFILHPWDTGVKPSATPTTTEQQHATEDSSKNKEPDTAPAPEEAVPKQEKEEANDKDDVVKEDRQELQSTAEETRYVNVRFGYKVTLPSGFALTSEADNGDGVVLTNENLGMTVQAYGGNNVLGETVEDAFEKAQQGIEPSYATSDDSMYVVSYAHGGVVYYEQCYVGDKSKCGIVMSYPKSRAGVCDSVVEQIVPQFVPGDLSTTH